MASAEPEGAADSARTYGQWWDWRGDYSRVPIAELHELCVAAYEAVGVTRDDATFLVDGSLDKTIQGDHARGVVYIPATVRGIQAGRQDPRAPITVTHAQGAVALVPETEIQRDARRHLPVILHVQVEALVLRLVRRQAFGRQELLEHRIAEQEVGEAVRIARARLAGEDAGEVVLPARALRLIVGAVIEAELAADLQVLRDSVLSSTACHASIELDNEEITGDFVMIEITNFGVIGPNLLLSPDAVPFDGLLDVFLVRADEREKLLSVICRQANSPPASTFPIRRARRIRFRAPAGERLHVDGETLDHDGPVDIRLSLLPGALRFYAPRSKADTSLGVRS